MMGTKVRRFAPLEGVSLDELVPRNHFYRHVERTIDLAFVRELVHSCYTPIGRPSVDPVVFFKLQLIMFFEGVRSERQLMEVAADRLSLRWFLGYDLDERLPDHSTLSKMRDRYGLEIFRRFFDRVVEQCQRAGLVWGKELYLDSTQVEANADKDQRLPRFYVTAINEQLAALFPGGAASPEPVPLASEAAPARLPVDLPPEIEAELAQKNAARHDWLADMGRPEREVTKGYYRRRADIWVNTTDPDATAMHKKGGGSATGYHTHYAVDGGKARIILTALVTPSEVMDNQPMVDLLWHCRFRWHRGLEHVTGDTKNGTVENIVAIEEAGLRAYIPLADLDKRSPFFGKQQFRYDAERDCYICPGGADLPFLHDEYGPRITKYQAAAATCNVCPLKGQCTESDKGRIVTRSFDEDYLDLVRSYQTTEPYKKALRKRKVWVEPLFGEAKQWHGLERFRLRMLEKVNIEALVTATGQNLKRLLSWWGWGRRWLPGGAAGVVIPPDWWSNPMAPV